MALKATLYKDPGDVVTYASGTDVTAGDIVHFNGRAGMVVDDIDVSTNGTGSLRIRGSIEVRKAGTAINAGDFVGWDVNGTAYSGLTGGCADNVEANKDFHLGVALVNAAATAATVVIDLNARGAASHIAAITDSTTGTAGSGLQPSGHGGTSATAIDNNFAELAAQIDALKVVLEKNALVKYA